MGKPNPLNSSSGFHRGRRKDTRKGLVSSTSSRRNTCKNKKCKTIRRRRHGRKHITRKISGGGSGELFVVVKYNDNEKPNDFKFEIDRIEYPGGTINWRKKGKSVALYRELVGKLKGASGNMGSSKTPVASYTPGGPPSSGQGTGGPVGANNGYGSMPNNGYGSMPNNANSKSTTPLAKEASKKENRAASYKNGDVIVSYNLPNNIDNDKNKIIGLNIGKIINIISGEHFTLKRYDNIEYNIDYKDALDKQKFMKLYDVKLTDKEIKDIQEHFNLVNKNPNTLNTIKNTDVVFQIAVDIVTKKQANRLDSFNLSNIIKTLIPSTVTTATKVTIPIDGKDTTEFAIATSLIDTAAAANPGTTASTSTKASPTNTTVEDINTDFLDKFDIHNDIGKKDEFITKINNLPAKIDKTFGRLNNLINENKKNNDITIQWRKFLTEINQYANDKTKDSEFSKFRSSSTNNVYFHMNDRITRAENLFKDNKVMIDKLIKVDYNNKAFNMSGYLNDKIDKLQAYYNKLIDDIKKDNTQIDDLIKKYNNKDIDNSRITKILNTIRFTKDELTQIENLTKNMKAKSDSINAFLKKCSEVIKEVSKNIIGDNGMKNLITTCKIIIRNNNNKKIEDLLNKYKIEKNDKIEIDDTNANNILNNIRIDDIIKKYNGYTAVIEKIDKEMFYLKDNYINNDKQINRNTLRSLIKNGTYEIENK